MVKCINNKCYESFLEIGKTYDVKHEHNGCYRIVHDDLGNCWLKSDRFVKITK